MKSDFIKGLGGKVRIYKTLTTGEKVFCGEFYNDITKAAKDAILSTMAQSGDTTKLGSSFYTQKIAFCSGKAPTDPIRDALNADGGAVVSYEALDIPTPEISTTSTHVTVVFTSSYVNSSGSTVRISFIAMVYADSPAASNVLGVVVLTNPPYVPIDVEDGETLTTEYTVRYRYGTYLSPV